VVSALHAACARHRVARAVPVHVLIETHGALAEVRAIAAVSGVRGLDLGLMDLVSGHHGAVPESAMRSPGQFEHALVVRAKTELASAALAHGRVPAHNVTVDVDDPAQAGRDARRAAESFGFLRMWSIHPDQIGPILDAFAPEPGAVEQAAGLLLAARRARWAPVRHAGRLHDRASYRHAWQLLVRARSAGRPLPADADAAFFATPPR
jgi:citrate lyase subunit beta/citryl-CoA lyase